MLITPDWKYLRHAISSKRKGRAICPALCFRPSRSTAPGGYYRRGGGTGKVPQHVQIPVCAAIGQDLVAKDGSGVGARGGRRTTFPGAGRVRGTRRDRGIRIVCLRLHNVLPGERNENQGSCCEERAEGHRSGEERTAGGDRGQNDGHPHDQAVQANPADCQFHLRLISLSWFRFR